MPKFQVNKTNRQNCNNKQSYNNNRNNNNRNNNYQQKKDNIFLLTVDNYYFIIEKKFVRKTHFFENLFMVDETSGHLRNPIFLQKMTSTPFKFIIQYLKRYYDNKDYKYEIEQTMRINDLYSSYNNNWDKIFIKEIHQKYKDNLEGFEELLKATHYIGVFNLYNKLKYCYDYIVNTKKYNLDDLDIEEDDELLDMMNEINMN